MNKRLEKSRLILIARFDDFLNSEHRNLWIESECGSVYLRKAFRYLNETPVKTIDIASIHIKPAFRGQGLFTAFFTAIHRKYPEIDWFIESITNNAVIHIFEKFGFKITVDFGDLISMYKFSSGAPDKTADRLADNRKPP